MQNFDEDLQSLTEAIWYWQSNPDPWSKSEEPQWESYSPELNLLLEEAYFDQQKEVDIGDWIVFLEQMLQTNKQDKSLQRPIRRIDWMEDEEGCSRSARYCEMESPKPFNNIFGELEDFLNFFSKRSPEMLKFAKLFREIEVLEKIDELNKKICPEIEKCITKEFLKLDPGKPSNNVSSLLKKKIQLKKTQNKEKLILSFRRDFKSFEDFFGEILRVYTMDTFLYRNLNKYLRDEDWGEINDLLPYAFCLCRAFLHEELRLEITLRSVFESSPLYRGTRMSEEAVEHFKTSMSRNFSWYAVTSTTRNRKMAEKFLEIGKAQDKKCRVLFIISFSCQAEWMSERLREKGLDISKYSVYPKEEEVLLPPGTLFTVSKISKASNETIIIEIEQKNFNELSILQFLDLSQELAIPGVIQSKAMNDRVTKFVCLEGEELCAALNSLHGNTLIEEMELYLCTFDNNSLGKMLKILPTMKRAKVIKFVLCLFEDKGKVSDEALIKGADFSNLAIQIYEIQNFYKIFGIFGNWKSLKSLSITFKKITNQGVSSLCSQGLHSLTHLVSLNLDFSNSFEITDEGIINLCSKGLRNLTELEYLNLRFPHCSEISRRGIHNLFHGGLKYLLKLKVLNLDFSFCDKISEKIICNVCTESLENLVDLKVNIKVYHPMLEHLAFTIRRLLNRVSDDRRIANGDVRSDVPASYLQSGFIETKELIEELLLKADLEFEKNGELRPQKNLRKFLLYSHSPKDQMWKTLSEYRKDAQNISRNENLRSFIQHQSPVEVTSQSFNLQNTWIKKEGEESNLNLKEHNLQTCFLPASLDFYPFWIRNKTEDDLIFSWLQKLMQKTSQDFDCSQTVVERVFLLYFEQIFWRVPEGVRFIGYERLAPYLEDIIAENPPSIRHPRPHPFFSKNSVLNRFHKTH